MSAAKIPLGQIENGEKIARIISLYEGFEERFDRLWIKVHQGMKEARCTPQDIKAAIREVRAKKA